MQLVYTTTDVNQQISLPLTTIAEGATLTVSWGDETSNDTFTVSENTALHTYAVAGTYTVTIAGQLLALGYSPATGMNYLKDVTEWDKGYITSFSNNCFNKGTLILCLIDNEEKYVPIQDLRTNVLVKTYKHGFQKVDVIGRSVMFNNGTNDRRLDMLYKCPVSNYPELFETLYITGAHSILVDSITDEQYKKTETIFGHLYMTDDKVRLMAYLDDRTVPYNIDGAFEIWHFSLESDDFYGNYGVYANGLLVETASKRWMLKYSRMEIIM